MVGNLVKGFQAPLATDEQSKNTAVMYGAPLRQNDSNVSEIYIGRPISISHIRYLYATADIQYPTARARAGISDIGYLSSLARQTLYLTVGSGARDQ